MKPHRPVDLETLNREFFSPDNSDEDIFSEEGSAPVDETEELFSSHPSLTPDVIEGLKNLNDSGNDNVFHDLPDDKKAADSAENASKVNEVSEEEALKSFPDFEFNPDIFDLPEQVHTEASDNDETIEELKEKAKQEIKDEKEKIKRQKKLEGKVQHPFKVRRILSFLMALFIIIGLLAWMFAAGLYKTGNTKDTMLNIGEYSVCYIDGTNIKSSNLTGNLVLFRKEAVSGTKYILFPFEDETRLEEVVAIGDGFCAVKLEHASSFVQPVDNTDIIGVMQFSTGNIRPLYDLIHNNGKIALISLTAYFVLIIGIFALLIRLQNKKIKQYREDYQLIN